jgi:hypothetical protein
VASGHEGRLICQAARPQQFLLLLLLLLLQLRGQSGVRRVVHSAVVAVVAISVVGSDSGSGGVGSPGLRLLLLLPGLLLQGRLRKHGQRGVRVRISRRRRRAAAETPLRASIYSARRIVAKVAVLVPVGLDVAARWNRQVRAAGYRTHRRCNGGASEGHEDSARA